MFSAIFGELGSSLSVVNGTHAHRLCFLATPVEVKYCTRCTKLYEAVNGAVNSCLAVQSLVQNQVVLKVIQGACTFAVRDVTTCLSASTE